MGYLIETSTALKLSQDFKKSSLPIVFTHGAFDLFHAGHSLFLNKSKKQGEILVVGLEPDSNIRKYKGRLRPIINQKQRAEILINHRAVDFVFFIDELTTVSELYYLNLYKKLKPSFVTIGNNFHAKDKKVYNLPFTTIKEIDSGVSSTTKIISSIIKIHED